ncbi:MAG: HAMP domain-containing histidine kinase [Deltaproteobacteria bacterium]|nr:HAMP domain-containing histidine kinase [Nannocystaceae bacterium]
MLADFIVERRAAIVVRARARVAGRTSRPSEVGLSNGIPVFLDQLVDALRIARSSDLVDHQAIRDSARDNGRDLLGMGLTIAQVVHDYGDVCQVITELATEASARIAPGEFRTMNLCIDDAIAEAVTEYARHNVSAIEREGTERLGVLAHEMRNLLNTATLSFENIRTGRVAVGGSTGLLHARSLMGLRDLIDRSLADVRLDAGIGRFEHIGVAALLEEVEIGAVIQAQSRNIGLSVGTCDRTVFISGDRQILAAALANLLQNAFKFSHKLGKVSLTTVITDDRVAFEIEDECGGLPPGKIDDLFRPFEQRGGDRSGVGLGLSICRKAAASNGGEIRVRDLPGKGCVFVLDLPRSHPGSDSGSSAASVVR